VANKIAASSSTIPETFIQQVSLIDVDETQRIITNPIDLFLKEKQNCARNSIHMNVVSNSFKSELFVYHGLPIESTSVNIIEWWKNRRDTLPTLFQIAQILRAIPATSVSSESVFSQASNLISKTRTNLSPSIVDQLLFLKSMRNFL
jgi:P2-related tail formation protein